MLNGQEVLTIFENSGALLEGHFRLTSGKHSPKFLQAALVLRHTDQASLLAGELADKFAAEQPELVVGPAIGGIILAHEVARALGASSCYSEKDGKRMVIRRGFTVRPGTKAVVVEDVVTTGGSVAKTVEHIRERGAEVCAIGALVDRSGGTAEFEAPFHALTELEIETYETADCPLCKNGIPLIEPDARRG